MMGGSTYVSSLIHRLLRDAKERRTLAAHKLALNADSEKVEKSMRWLVDMISIKLYCKLEGLTPAVEVTPAD